MTGEDSRLSITSKLTKVALVGLLASFAVVGPAFGAKDADGNHGPKGYSNNFDGEDQNTQECNGDAEQYVDYVGPTNLWPPNHKAVDGIVRAVDNDDDSSTSEATPTLVLRVGSNDEFEEGDATVDYGAEGAGMATDPAGYQDNVENGIAPANVIVLRERSGQSKDAGGRVYTIEATAMFADNGDPQTSDSCTVYFCIRVPHDMRKTDGNRSEPCTPDPSVLPAQSTAAALPLGLG
jgi:hypothetical protein